MKKQVIATINMAGELVPCANTQRFVLYQRKEAQWIQTDYYEPQHTNNAQTLRDVIRELNTRFECRVIVSRKIVGVAYQMLNQSGFEIFEAEAITDDLMDGIMDDILSAQAAQDDPPQQPYSPQNDGNYFLDLVRLQKAFPEVSSKRALMSFMQNAAFLSLELVCDHLPPWMENLIKEKDLLYRLQRENGVSKVIISKKQLQY
jgi:hypothetical protein